MNVNNKSGFTLPEVLLAVVIISMVMLGLQQVLGTALSGHKATKKNMTFWPGPVLPWGVW